MGLFLSESDFLFNFVFAKHLFLCNHDAYISEIDLVLPMCVCVGGFPHSSVGKESACSVGDLGLIPGSGRSPGKGKGYPLQYSGLENRKVAKSWTRLSAFRFSCMNILKFSGQAINSLSNQ